MKRLLPFVLCLSLFLTACGGAVRPTAEQACDKTIFAMDTVMDLTAYGPNADQALTDVVRRINDLEKHLSVTREDSDVWAVNHARGEPVGVSEDVGYLVESAQALGAGTGGALDITLYPVLKAWGFTTGDYQVPDDGTIAQLLEKVDYRAIDLHLPEDTSEEVPCALLLPQGMELDFGALAKGYAGEVCARQLKEAGVTSAILRLGGNIQTVGSKPDGSPWRVGIQDPAGDSDETFGLLALTDQAAVTSGGYQRYFEADGVRYWHILDPQTGRPARSGLTSVTVVGDSGTLCDGLSTALFVMGRDRALDYWRQTGGFEAVLADEDKNLWVTAGLADRFTLSADSGYTLNMVEK